jgi:hypothetical protein
MTIHTLPSPSPVIEIAGRKLTLKFSMVATYYMGVFGVTSSSIRGMGKSPAAVADLFKIFACLVAHNFISDDPTQPTKVPPPEYWAAQCDTPGDLARISEAVLAVVAGEAAKQKLAAANRSPTTPASQG